MRLYIWEGRGISAAYHDDGTLVVLAHTAAEAREIARASASSKHDWDDRYKEGAPAAWWDRWDWKEINPRVDRAIDRPPDRVVELDTPCVVAFNGGGYD